MAFVVVALIVTGPKYTGDHLRGAERCLLAVFRESVVRWLVVGVVVAASVVVGRCYCLRRRRRRCCLQLPP